MPDLVIETVEITPDLARDMLGKNTHNRSTRARHVSMLAEDMRHGKWQLNGDAIKFDVHGILLDGQHRLQAVVEADVPVMMLVVWNVDPLAQTTYDTGARRTFADVLALMGETSTTVMATAVRTHLLYTRGEVQSNSGLTHAQLLAHFVDKKETFREACRLQGQVRSHLPYPASAISATFAEILHRGEHNDDLEDFVGKLKTGAALDAGHPVLTFRAYATNVASAATKPTPAVLFAVFIKTWNAYIEGRRVQALAFRAGGVSPERFPTIL